MTASLLQKLVRKYVWRMDIHPSAVIARTALIDRTWPRGVHIARDVRIDEDAVVLTHDMVRGLYLDTRIGAGSRIGVRAIILPGITIGEGCTILPGALVHRDVPDGATVGGNPAKIVE
jgi:acetyltransferase-like isoleucine patch superfamily enzyme